MRPNPTVRKQGSCKQQPPYVIPKSMQSSSPLSAVLGTPRVALSAFIDFIYLLLLLWSYFINFKQLLKDYKNPILKYYFCIYELKNDSNMNIVIISLFAYMRLKWLWIIPFYDFRSFFSGHPENNDWKFQQKIHSKCDDSLFSETCIDWVGDT